jgi:hypothetical protein
VAVKFLDGYNRDLTLEQLQETPPWEWPRTAGDFLRTLLEDRGRASSDRTIAAGLAGDMVVMNDRMAQTLLSIVRNAEETEELRATAAIALGPALEEGDTIDFDDPPEESAISQPVFDETRDTLHAIFADAQTPDLVRRRVLEAAVRAPMDWQEAAVRQAYRNNAEDWKLTAVFCMQYVPGFDREIVSSLAGPNPDIRYEAVRAAGAREVKGAWPNIAPILASPPFDKPLLLAAIEAAGSIGGDDAGLLLAELADSEDEEISETANDALLMLEDDWLDDEEDDEDEA